MNYLSKETIKKHPQTGGRYFKYVQLTNDEHLKHKKGFLQFNKKKMWTDISLKKYVNIN